jgi:hypothetical protein
MILCMAAKQGPNVLFCTSNRTDLFVLMMLYFTAALKRSSTNSASPNCTALVLTVHEIPYSSPLTCNSTRRSKLMEAGIVRIRSYPFAAAMKAKPMPVLPVIDNGWTMSLAEVDGGSCKHHYSSCFWGNAAKLPGGFGNSTQRLPHGGLSACPSSYLSIRERIY